MNQKGFSLVSVMVAAGLAGGLALVGTRIISNLTPHNQGHWQLLGQNICTSVMHKDVGCDW